MVIDKFKYEEDARPSSSSSAGSILKAADWLRIERLLRETVVDNHDKKSKKLSHTIHHLAVTNSLLQNENEGLRARLLNEKKRRKRGKQVTYEDGTGAGQFWAPKTVYTWKANDT